MNEARKQKAQYFDKNSLFAQSIYRNMVVIVL